MVTEWTGRSVSWLVLLLTVLIGYDVCMRYLFHSGSVALQELQWHLFAVIFLFGAAYTIKYDDHVRLDLFYQSQRLNDRHRAWIDLLGTMVLLFPYVCVLIYSTQPFVWLSFSEGERSADPGGLGYRWLIKFCIPAGFFLLLLQGIAEVINKLQRVLDLR